MLKANNPWAARRLRGQGAGPRLERLLRRRRPAEPPAVHRLAPEGHDRRGGAGGQPAAGGLEGPTSPCHQLETTPTVLPKAFADERFAFYGTTLRGTPQQQARWKRAVNATNDALGEAVGKLYVAKYFPPASKAAGRGHGRAS